LSRKRLEQGRNQLKAYNPQETIEEHKIPIKNCKDLQNTFIREYGLRYGA